MKMRLRLPRTGARRSTRSPSATSAAPSEDASLSGGATVQLVYRLEINEYRGSCASAVELPARQDRVISVLGFAPMEINQIKRSIKDLEERTDSLRRYL